MGGRRQELSAPSPSTPLLPAAPTAASTVERSASSPLALRVAATVATEPLLEAGPPDAVPPPPGPPLGWTRSSGKAKSTVAWDGVVVEVGSERGSCATAECDGGSGGMDGADPSNGGIDGPVSTRVMDWHTFRYALVVAVLQALALAMVVPVRPKLLLDAVGGSASTAAAVTGGLSSLDAIIEVISNPLLGHASDLYGRRGVLLLAQIGLVIDFGLIATFSDQWRVYVVATLVGASTGVFFMTLSTVTADLAVGTGEEATAYGILGATYGLAFAAGPAVGGAIAAASYPTAPLHTAMAVIGLNALFVWCALPETAPSGVRLAARLSASRGQGGWATSINPLPRLQVLFQSDVLRWLGATVAASGVATGGLGSILFYYTNVRFGWGPPETGRFFSALGVSMIVSQGLLARPLVALLGERPFILTGFVLDAVHLVMYGLARKESSMYVALAVATVGYASGPALKGLIARQVGPDEQGALQGGLAALATIVRPAAPLVTTGLFGYFNDRGRPGVPLYVMGSLTLVATVIAAKALSHPHLK
ncbi:hypothetical protein MMPV_002968 [Pyropia vietnamensis]